MSDPLGIDPRLVVAMPYARLIVAVVTAVPGARFAEAAQPQGRLGRKVSA